VIPWFRDTLGIYRRTLGRGAALLLHTPVLVVPALACLVVPLLTAAFLAPLGAAMGSIGMVMGGIASVLIESACWSALLACTGEVIRTRRLVLRDVRSGFVAYLGDVVNVRFVLWLITFLSVALPGPLSVMIALAAVTFFNAVPELIYLGRHGTADLLAASYRFVGERWIEWFPMNALLLALLVIVGIGLAFGDFLPSGVAVFVGVLATAATLAFAMLVRGLLFLELTESSRRARAFHRASGE
jgi:hypothetical protein